MNTYMQESVTFQKHRLQINVIKTALFVKKMARINYAHNYVKAKLLAQ